jgi:hypothetical protein
MSNMFQHMRDTPKAIGIRIPFDPDRSPRQQIEAAIASVKARVCERHPHEILPVDMTATILSALHHDYPNEEQPRAVEFTAICERCAQCPHSDADHDIEVEHCPVGVVRLFYRVRCIRDEMGRPLVRRYGSQPLEADRSARELLNEWNVKAAEFRCDLSNQPLRLREASMTEPLKSWNIVPEFATCLQCRLESLGITPDEAHASFDRLLIDPPVLEEFLRVCRAFAEAPNGVLLLLGNVGTGKTYLAICILRELLRRRVSGLRFIKHRHFLDQHWKALLPVPFNHASPVGPLAGCQESPMLHYDELTKTTDICRAYESVLLDLFEYRIGHFKPTIVTANLNRAELETVLGSKLYDRLRRAAFAVLEFGFESKRQSFNAEYLNRARPGGHA